MNRFDKAFNSVDPETARPFSGGHPDGVWMISIVYGFILFFALVAALYGIYQSIFGEEMQLKLIGGALVVYGLLLPPIVLLFKRSKKSITWLGGLFVLAAFLLVSTYLSTGASVLPLLAVVCAQGYICFYSFGLVKDKLIYN